MDGRFAGPADRLVDAPGVLAERVAGRGVGACATAAAGRSELAAAAPSAKPVRIAQGQEERMLPVDADQVVAADIARRERHEAARTDRAKVVDEDEAVAVG